MRLGLHEDQSWPLPFLASLMVSKSSTKGQVIHVGGGGGKSTSTATQGSFLSYRLLAPFLSVYSLSVRVRANIPSHPPCFPRNPSISFFRNKKSVVSLIICYFNATCNHLVNKTESGRCGVCIVLSQSFTRSIVLSWNLGCSIYTSSVSMNSRRFISILLVMHGLKHAVVGPCIRHPGKCPWTDLELVPTKLS